MYFKEDISPEGICMFQPSDVNGVQALKLFVRRYNVFYTDDTIYCDTRSEPPKRLLPFETDCELTGEGRLPITFSNDGEDNLQFEITCWDSHLETFTLEVNSKTDIDAVLYDGQNKDYGDACVFLPWLDRMQYVDVSTREGGESWLNYRLHCDAQDELNKPAIIVESECTPDGQGIMPISIDNSDDELVHFRFRCTNGFLEIDLEPFTSGSLDAMFYLAPDYAYPSDVCVLLYDEDLCGDKVQQTWVISEKDTGGFSTKIVPCETVQTSYHSLSQYRSTCEPNKSGVVPINLINNNDYSLRFTLTCANGVFQHIVPAGSTAVFPAVFFTLQDRVPGNACVFALAPDGVTQQVLVVVTDKNTVLFGTLLCDSEIPKPVVPYTTSCEPKDGLVELVLRNEGDVPLSTRLYCRNGEVPLTIGPHSTQTVPAAFYSPSSKVPGACMFLPIPNDVDQHIYLRTSGQDQGTLDHFIRCRNRDQAGPPTPNVECGCTPDSDDVFTVFAHNHEAEDVTLHIICRNTEFDVTVAAAGSFAMTAVFFQGEDVQYPQVDCLLIDWQPYLGESQAACIQASRGDNFTVEYVMCTKQTPPSSHNPDEPIVHLIPSCPKTFPGAPYLEMRADVPAYAVAKCRNGDKEFTTLDDVAFTLDGRFEQDYLGDDCLFYPLDFFVVRNFPAYAVASSLDKGFIPRWLGLPRYCNGELLVIKTLASEDDAVAKCRNGDKEFTTLDDVSFALDGSFEHDYLGDDCSFYKKDGSNTYTVDVQMGWGEHDSKIIQLHRMKTVSCAYDDHGSTLSSSEFINDWFLSPPEMLTLKGDDSSSTFSLEVIDVMDRVIDHHIAIGRKIRLRAVDTSGRATAFRALSCEVSNDASSYAILRAGCGDGLVFKKSAGFQTFGNQVFSPYFDAFKIHGSNIVRFTCQFVVCPTANCDGDSCKVENRKKRSIEDAVTFIHNSRPFRLADRS